MNEIMLNQYGELSMLLHGQDREWRSSELLTEAVQTIKDLRAERLKGCCCVIKDSKVIESCKLHGDLTEELKFLTLGNEYTIGEYKLLLDKVDKLEEQGVRWEALYYSAIDNKEEPTCKTKKPGG